MPRSPNLHRSIYHEGARVRKPILVNERGRVKKGGGNAKGLRLVSSTPSISKRKEKGGEKKNGVFFFGKKKKEGEGAEKERNSKRIKASVEQYQKRPVSEGNG